MNALRRFLPSRETIRNSRMLRWLGPRLHDPQLWHINRRAVARGAAAGTFFGLMIPVAQIPAAVIAALLLRGNLWIAAVTTLVSNPFTYAPLYYFAYRLGAQVLDRPELSTPQPEVIEASMSSVSTFAQAWHWISGIGQPLLLGMAIMATVGATVAYFGTLWLWRMHTALKRRQRARQRNLRTGAQPLGRT